MGENYGKYNRKHQTKKGNVEDMKIICADCNTILSNENDKCNKCGSTNKIINIYIEDKISTHEAIRYKVKDETKNSKKNPVLEVLQGEEIQKCTGEWVNKVRKIDKTNDRYYEHIETLDGKEIHHCDEKLTDHQGHGNAKTSWKIINE